MLAAAAEATSPIKYKAAIGYDFEKVLYPTVGTSQPDGIVGYLGNGAVGVPGEESNIANNAGDRGQSYSWSAASSDGWLYVGTCYLARCAVPEWPMRLTHGRMPRWHRAPRQTPAAPSYTLE